MHASDFARPITALLGGSFNPPHIGHFRLALEVQEALRPERLLFVPSANPPHKPASNLLPFDLRAEMLAGAIRGLPGMEICTIENERPGPSYTVDTLAALSERYPASRPAFIMGGEDLPLLPTWDRWERLADLADLAVLPRGGADREYIGRIIRAQWPGAQASAMPLPDGEAKDATADALLFRLPGGGRIFYLDRPRLEVRSSALRERWLAGHRLDFLIPEPVLALLEKNRDVAGALWRKKPLS